MPTRTAVNITRPAYNEYFKPLFRKESAYSTRKKQVMKRSRQAVERQMRGVYVRFDKRNNAEKN